MTIKATMGSIPGIHTPPQVNQCRGNSLTACPTMAKDLLVTNNRWYRSCFMSRDPKRRMGSCLDIIILGFMVGVNCCHCMRVSCFICGQLTIVLWQLSKRLFFSCLLLFRWWRQMVSLVCVVWQWKRWFIACLQGGRERGGGVTLRWGYKGGRRVKDTDGQRGKTHPDKLVWFSWWLRM